MTAALVDRLRSLIGERNVLDAPEDRSAYERDATGRFVGEALAVVLPSDAREVADVVALCADARVPLVPQGGNTGLVGGATPPSGSVVVSTRRLRSLGEVDPVAGLVEAGAGTTLEELDGHVASHGLHFPIDHAARSGATVGGTIATNAGGALAWRSGTARAHIAGLEAVMADGTTLRRLGGLVKDNTGYDLTQLLIGSEGTLGIVTAATLRLSRRPRSHATALLGLARPADLLPVLTLVRRRCPDLVAAEFFMAQGLELVVAHTGARRPFDAGARLLLLIECAADADPLPQLLDALAELALERAVVASDDAERSSLWELRERHNEAIRAARVPRKLDVSVPPRRLPDFIDAVERRLALVAPDVRVILFGHAGDGNVHVNLLADGGGHDLDEEVLRVTLAHEGSVGAEHGMGRSKARWLSWARSPAELAAMRALKSALDPDGIMNPGALFE